MSHQLLIDTAELLAFVLEDTNGDEVAGLGTTFTVEISKNGGAFAASTGTKAEIGSGWYSYELTADETDTTGPLAVKVTGSGAVQQNLLYEVAGFVFVAGTPATAYCSLAELKARLGIDDVVDDTILTNIIEGVSREIDNDTGRRFYTTDEDEIRYETAETPTILFPHEDIISLTTLATDLTGDRTYPTAWAATDYDMLPHNAALDGKPYTWIVIAPRGRYSFPAYRKGVKLTGKFGYSATAPAVVREACLLQSERLFKRKDAPFGVFGNQAAGFVQLKAELDPDVKKLLDGVRRVSL